jgi:hypothetical protein
MGLNVAKIDLGRAIALPTAAWIIYGLAPAGWRAPARTQAADRAASERLVGRGKFVRQLPENVAGVHHKSSRNPLKNGWRTFPSTDFARYSISASSFGSTQMPLCAIRLA